MKNFIINSVLVVIFFAGNAIVLRGIPYFPDVVSYNEIIKEGYFFRFIYEPASMFIFIVLHLLEFDAVIYYLFVWLLSLICVWKVTEKFDPSVRSHVFIFIVFNPLNLISLQVPRFYMAMHIGLFIVTSFGLRKKVFSSVLAAVSHNIAGLYMAVTSISRSLLTKKNASFIITALSFSMALILFFLWILLELGFSLTLPYGITAYLSYDHTVGRYQMIYFVAFALLFMSQLFLTRRVKLGIFYLALTSVTLAIYNFTPIGYRFFNVVLCWILLDACTRVAPIISLIVPSAAIGSATFSILLLIFFGERFGFK